MAVYDDRDASHVQYMQTTSLVSYAGAVVSLALVAGVTFWGYQLVMRDVSGIPVVRAAEGAMRVAPQNAGGEIADHAGLAVNEVAGEGEAAGPADSLLLAPETQALAEEDMTVISSAEAEEVIPAAEAVPLEQEIPAVVETTITTNEAEPLTTEGLISLADQIAGTTTPLGELAEIEAESPLVVPDNADVAAEAIDTTIPGVTRSLRPSVRPASLVIQASAPAADTTAENIAAQVADTTTAVAAALEEAQIATSAPLPTGTHLVQLGAYPTSHQAAEEWTRIKGQFAEFMGDKDQVIQEATSGGSTFYRLRASGFAKGAAARRFCEALKAGNAECIPVVVR